MRTRSFFAGLLVTFTLAGPGSAFAGDLGPTSGERVLDEALETTRTQWYDRKGRDKIDWKGLRAKYMEQVRTADSALEAHHLVNKALGELKTSHLVLMEGDVYDRELNSEFTGKKTARGGFEVTRLADGYFVCIVYEGSTAEKAGLKVGDQVVSVNGEKAESTDLLEEAGHDPGLADPPGYVLKVGKDAVDVTLGVKSETKGAVHEVRFSTSAISMLEATKSSIRIVEKNGQKLGVIHLWHFMTTRMVTVLQNAVKKDGALAECDGLILDVRGRGGLANVVWSIESIFRGKDSTWKKPVVVLQDHGTRSAKEIFAWAWKRDKVGPIVGQTTAGACIGCTFKKLSDGSVLVHPVADVAQMTGGTLEGKGVDPDVVVDPGDLRYRNGRDPILDRGIEVCAKRVAAIRAASRFY